MIKQTKDNYDKHFIDSAGNSPQKLWKVINSLLGKTKQNNPITLQQNNVLIEDPYEVANKFNEQFNNVGKLFGAEPTGSNDFIDYLPKKQMNNFEFKEVTLDEMYRVIRSLNTRKSSHDRIPAFLFKKIPINIIKRFVYITNRSIMEGIFPDSLKYSKIIPVYKNDSKLDCKNYRPISLLSYIDKIFEKLIHSRLYEYLTDIGFFSRNQYGFRTHHSAEHALLSLTDRIYKHIDSKRKILLVSIDLRKAFEVVRHDILLKKLENAGIRGTILNWFTSFMTGRKHQTLINSTLSDSLLMKTGIPKGSCLGPLLFLVYINDMNQVFDEDEINIFADDTVLIINGEKIDDMKRLANIKLVKLYNYLTANGIQLNNNKSQYMIIQRKDKILDDDIHINIDGDVIQEVNCLTLLGVKIDKQLNFNDHICKLRGKIRKLIPVFFRLRRSMSTANMLKIYFAYVHSNISYGLQVYGRGNKSNIAKIELLQKRILKVIFRCHSCDIPQILEKHNILDVNNLLTYKVLIMAYKTIYMKNSLPIFLQNQYIHYT